MNDPGTRVDFYLLQSTGQQARLRFACRLTEKAWHLDNRVHALVSAVEQLQELDELMWTFRAGSFLPHETLDATRQPAAPVSIGQPGTAPPAVDLLINLTDELPEWHASCARIAEVVGAESACVTAGRERYRYYRDQGYALETHRIGA